MKNLKNLKGANKLSRNEQKNVFGGKMRIPKCKGTGSGISCNGNFDCPRGEGCYIDGTINSGGVYTIISAHCHCL